MNVLQKYDEGDCAVSRLEVDSECLRSLQRNCKKREVPFGFTSMDVCSLCAIWRELLEEMSLIPIMI